MSKNLAAPFASFFGLGRAKGARAEGDDDKDDKDAKGSRAEGDDDKDDGDSDAKGSRAEGDDDKDDKDAKGSKAVRGDDDGDDADAEDEEDDDAAKSEDGDDNDGDDEKDAKSKRAAKAERTRGARIMSAGFRLGRGKEAAVLAFDTGLSSSAAISILNAQGAVQPQRKPTASLRERMNTEPGPRRVEGKQAADANTAAEKILAAGRKRRGEAE
jgi:hypothetical protein